MDRLRLYSDDHPAGGDNPFGNAAPAQAPVWDLESRAPQPQPLAKASVADVSGTWVTLYTVPYGSFVQVKEILLFNGDAGDVTFRFAFLDDDDSVPSGSTLGQDNVHISRTLATGVSDVISLETSLQAGWRIAAYTSAAAGVKANVMITGLVVSYLA